MGPDPASINAATIGGVLANNAGGMRCRPEIDSYHSTVAMKIILTTGTIVDTEDPHTEEMRNTTGYAIHASLEGETPVEILRRLMFGSEGTLGFVAEAVYKTYHLPPKRWSHGYLSIQLTQRSSRPGAQAVELMVASALIIGTQSQKQLASLASR